MNERQLRHVIHCLAEAQAPDELDLWPAIQAQYTSAPSPETSQLSPTQGNLVMHPKIVSNRGRRLAAVIALATLTLAVAALITPQGQAWAQQVLHFFTRAQSDTLPVQPWQLTPVPQTTAPDPANISDASQPVSAVEQQAGFDVLEPAWLPQVLLFQGATFEPEHTIARIFYRENQGGPDNTNGLVLREEPFQKTDACELCGVVGASASVETVQIGAVTGEYVEGVWNLTDSGPVWDPNPYLKTMRWQAQGMAFELLYMGQPETVTKADLIAIAQSLK